MRITRHKPEVERIVALLEPLPITAQRVLELVQGQDVSWQTIVELIELDPVVTATVMRRSTSARFAGGGPPVRTVREAIMRLGTLQLLDVVMEGYVQKLGRSAPLFDLSEQELWLHGAAAREAVRALTRARPHLQLPALTETAALLHDIGKLVLSRQFQANTGTVAGLCAMHNMTRLEAEHALFGTDHAEVGGAIADSWQFPEEIAHAIRWHHAPDSASESQVLDAVVVANAIAGSAGAACQDDQAPAVDPQCLVRLGLDLHTYARLATHTAAYVVALQQGHSVVGPPHTPALASPRVHHESDPPAPRSWMRRLLT